MKIRFFIIVIFVLNVISGFTQEKLDNAVELFLQNSEYKNASIGICIQDLETGDKLFGLNDEKLLIPASTMKLITSATALELLGADYHFETKMTKLRI